jgi:hypothetical protein
VYGLDLLDMYRGVISPGKVLRLIQWLPDDGAFAASLHGGPEFLGMGRDRVLAMDQWDLTAAAAAGKKAPKYPRPKTTRGR